MCPRSIISGLHDGRFAEVTLCYTMLSKNPCITGASTLSAGYPTLPDSGTSANHDCILQVIRKVLLKHTPDGE